MNSLDYLKRYTKNNKCKETKKKALKNLTIIDDDIILDKINHADSASSADEDPIIVNVIDERPEKLIQIESYRLNKQWKVVSSPKYNDDVISEVCVNLNSNESYILPQQLPYSNTSFLNNNDGDLSPKRKSNNKSFSNLTNNNKKKSNNNLINQHVSINKNNKIPKIDDISKFNEASNLYKRWSSGIKQLDIRNSKIIDVFHEIEKPMARYMNDEDLNNQLRQVEHVDDPMLDYIRKKNKSSKTATLPLYKGPEPPPNRYKIKPGYRWDGVDRSNGFECKYYANINERKIFKDMSYKWSTEDM